MAYEKKHQPGLFSATAYCTVICMFLFMPMLGLLDILLELQKPQRKKAVIIYLILIIVGVFLRYYRKNQLERILARYRGSVYNKRIQTWLFFLILPLSMVIGVWVYALVCKL